MLGYRLQPHFAQVLIELHFVEDRSPKGHFPSAMRDQLFILSFNNVFYFPRRECSTIPLGNSGQVGHRMLQGDRGWSMPSAVDSVARSAVVTEYFRSLEGIAGGRGLARLLSRPDEQDGNHEEQQ